MLIRFEEHVDLISSRQGGKFAKEKFQPLIKTATPSNKVVFDFSGVTSISSSFADEFFGMLIAEMGFNEFKSITTFSNISPFVGSVVRNSIYHRNKHQFA